jgi:multidrug efflux pump subunit AcrA (membrane-fusion protein)
MTISLRFGWAVIAVAVAFTAMVVAAERAIPQRPPLAAGQGSEVVARAAGGAPDRGGTPSAASAPARSASPGSRSLVIEHCLVSPEADLQIPAQEAGLMVAVDVAENALVQAGTVLAKLDDRKPQLEMTAAKKEREAALAKAADDIETRYAQAAFEAEDAELEKLMAAKSKQERSVSDSEVRRVRLNRHKAELQIERSKLERQIFQFQADVHEAAVLQAQQAVERRKIVAPIDGVIVALFRRPGEWVNAGEPVAQLVKMDVLRAEGFVSAAEYDVVELADREVTVEVERAGQRRETFRGRITVVSPLVQAGNKYRVRAEVVNRAEAGHWLLRPGMSARMTVHLP